MSSPSTSPSPSSIMTHRHPLHHVAQLMSHIIQQVAAINVDDLDRVTLHTPLGLHLLDTCHIAITRLLAVPPTSCTPAYYLLATTSSDDTLVQYYALLLLHFHLYPSAITQHILWLLATCNKCQRYKARRRMGIMCARGQIQACKVKGEKHSSFFYMLQLYKHHFLSQSDPRTFASSLPHLFSLYLLLLSGAFSHNDHDICVREYGIMISALLEQWSHENLKATWYASCSQHNLTFPTSTLPASLHLLFHLFKTWYDLSTHENLALREEITSPTFTLSSYLQTKVCSAPTSSTQIHGQYITKLYGLINIARKEMVVGFRVAGHVWRGVEDVRSISPDDLFPSHAHCLPSILLSSRHLSSLSLFAQPAEFLLIPDTPDLYALNRQEYVHATLHQRIENSIQLRIDNVGLRWYDIRALEKSRLAYGCLNIIHVGDIAAERMVGLRVFVWRSATRMHALAPMNTPKHYYVGTVVAVGETGQLHVLFDGDHKTLSCDRDICYLYIPLTLSNLRAIPCTSLLPPPLPPAPPSSSLLSVSPKTHPSPLISTFGLIKGVVYHKNGELVLTGEIKRNHDPTLGHIDIKFLPPSLLPSHKEEAVLHDALAGRWYVGEEWGVVVGMRKKERDEFIWGLRKRFSTPSSLLFFDRGTYIRIGGERSLHFQGYQPFTICCNVFVPLHMGSVNKRQTLFSKLIVSPHTTKPLYINYMLELMPDFSLLATVGNTVLSSNALEQQRRNFTFHSAIPSSAEEEKSRVSTLEQDKWNHIALRYDGVSLALYINFQQVTRQEIYASIMGGMIFPTMLSKDTSSSDAMHGSLLIGARMTSNNTSTFGNVAGLFGGFMSDFSVFSIAHSHTFLSTYHEIQGHEPHLLAYWSLREMWKLGVDGSGNNLHCDIVKVGEGICREVVYDALWSRYKLQFAQHYASSPVLPSSLHEPPLPPAPWMPIPPTCNAGFHSAVDDRVYFCGRAHYLDPKSERTIGAHSSDKHKPVAFLCSSAPPLLVSYPENNERSASRAGGIWNRCSVQISRGFDCDLQFIAHTPPEVPDASMMSPPLHIMAHLYSGHFYSITSPLHALTDHSSHLLLENSVAVSIMLLPYVDEEREQSANIDDDEVAAASARPQLPFHNVLVELWQGDEFGQKQGLARSQHMVPLPKAVDGKRFYRLHLTYRPLHHHDLQLTLNSTPLVKITCDLHQKLRTVQGREDMMIGVLCDLPQVSTLRRPQSQPPTSLYLCGWKHTSNHLALDDPLTDPHLPSLMEERASQVFACILRDIEKCLRSKYIESIPQQHCCV